MSDYRTYAFGQFKEELTHLSQLRWVFCYCQSFVEQAIRNPAIPTTESLTTTSHVTDFPDERLKITVQDFFNQRSGNEDHFNLLLLVKACASMEHYLHKMAQIWAIEQGHFDACDVHLLNSKGKFLIKRARKSALDESLKCLQRLLSVDFGNSLKLVKEAYKLRCVAAHTGGVLDEKAILDFPMLSGSTGSRIYLRWDRLNDYLKAILSCCSQVEKAIPKRKRMRGELTVIIGGLIKSGALGYQESKTSRIPLGRSFHAQDVTKLRRMLVEKFEFRSLPNDPWFFATLDEFKVVVPKAPKPKKMGR